VKNLVDTRFFTQEFVPPAAQTLPDPLENSPARYSPQGAALTSGMVGKGDKQAQQKSAAD